MSRSVLILHGWSDKKGSFKPLARYLSENGFRVTPIYLGDYVSLEDNLTIEDLAKAFETALTKEGISRRKGAFELIVHSTGTLIAREWMARFYLERGRDCPVAHFLMLAPANFGSPLAHKGRTMLGRIVKGWKTGFETGTRILKALEMASPYTWNLARRDLFGSRSFYQPADCMAAVLVGTSPYKTGLRSLVNARGSDGTVYVCTANLNTSGLTLRLGGPGRRAEVTPWSRKASAMAFAAIPKRDHDSIRLPRNGRRTSSLMPDASLGQLALDFLRLRDAEEYRAYARRCARITRQSLPPDPFKDLPNERHSYQNTVVHVEDDLGMSVEDYFLEFYESDGRSRSGYRGDDLMVKVQKEVLEKVHPYKADESYRSLLFDLTDLDRTLSSGARLRFSLSAAPLGKLIRYAATSEKDIGELQVGMDNSMFWRPNETLFIRIVIERKQADRVFRLERYH